MDRRHKKKALAGFIIWISSIVCLILEIIILNHLAKKSGSDSVDHLWGPSLLLFLVIQYGSFFWGVNHYAKAKGYSNAMGIFGVIWPVQLVIFPMLVFALPDKFPENNGRSEPRRVRHKDESLIARIVRYRRNALVANVLGLAGIALALMVGFIPIGLFESRDNMRVAGILVFLPSYVMVICGCWYWVRSKNWPDAVVFIGLAPLAPLLIPYFRILYLMAGILPLLMVVMPLLMIGVVAVLPDKSGMPKRKRWDRD